MPEQGEVYTRLNELGSDGRRIRQADPEHPHRT